MGRKEHSSGFQLGFLDFRSEFNKCLDKVLRHMIWFSFLFLGWSFGDSGVGLSDPCGPFQLGYSLMILWIYDFSPETSDMLHRPYTAVQLWQTQIASFFSLGSYIKRVTANPYLQSTWALQYRQNICIYKLHGRVLYSIAWGKGSGSNTPPRFKPAELDCSSLHSCILWSALQLQLGLTFQKLSVPLKKSL